jgi:hypothetical protein
VCQITPAFRASFPRCSPRTPHLLWQPAAAVAFFVVLTGWESPRRKSSRQDEGSESDRLEARIGGHWIDSEGHASAQRDNDRFGSRIRSTRMLPRIDPDS